MNDKNQISLSEKNNIKNIINNRNRFKNNFSGKIIKREMSSHSNREMSSHSNRDYSKF